MTAAQPDVMVIGAGPAGLAAVTELAQRGVRVMLVEQRDQVGGAIYRRRVGHQGTALLMPEHQRRRRDALLHGFFEAQARVALLMQSVFIGVDRDGRFLIDNRPLGRVQAVRPKAVILAVGTVEQVAPREGWELAGVTTVGGMQVQFKETGHTPQGKVLIAGSGPLLLALAAQLAAAENPPVAVLERAQPFGTAWWQGRSVFNALRSWPQVQEAALYARELWRARVPYLTGWEVLRICQTAQGLEVSSRHPSGLQRVDHVQHVALHDGLVPNATGLPAPAQGPASCVVHAGDCREVLGAQAAVADGRRAALQVANYLGHAARDADLDAVIDAARRTQAALTMLYQAPPMRPSANTVLCRCEGARRADVERLPALGSAHELRLVARFGMGACQGRSCARSISDLAREHGVLFDPGAINGDVPRWPLRPVAVTALAAYAQDA